MMYSKRRINLGRRSKKSSNRALKRLRGGSSSSIESPNDTDELPKGFSQFNVANVAKWYPEGTEILKINKKGERLPIITLPEKRILQFYDLGDRIIGFKKPTIIPSSNKRRPSAVDVKTNDHVAQPRSASNKSFVKESLRIPKGYSLPIGGFRYPVGTILRIIDKDSNEEKDIKLDLPEYLSYFYLGNKIIGVKNLTDS
jgi:hypothetical protein